MYLKIRKVLQRELTIKVKKNINTWTNTNAQPNSTKQQIPAQHSARHDVISPELR